ncbi:hypothetical protein B296_00027589 [Ensete ventricosum]|uniref:Peroxidase n=1 Tax=Ensete ventricosum TaxID=4639 RepID=A0A426YRS8_ENSVE|nr:hypothetical protein B296_00027589 [Ensete ventricosum]
MGAELCRSLLVVVMVVVVVSGEAQLRPNFYQFACPEVESIVRQAVMKKVRQTFVTVPATLRLFFHDCFVEVKFMVFLDLQGCDASVMIASPRRDAEKDAPDNLSLAGDGFDTVIKAKQAVEARCPGVVSCADVLAIAARDVVVLVSELGRRDGLISQARRVAGRLPGPDFNLNLLADLFRMNNLTTHDMVALSGAHTVGFSHCSRLAKRLYTFGPSSPVDPSLNLAYARLLMRACPRDVGPTIAVNMDPFTPTVFDNVYYRNLLKGEGLFTSDQVLFSNLLSRPVVKKFAADQSSFFMAFAASMVKLGRVGVKTGHQGEIRKDCTAFN